MSIRAAFPAGELTLQDVDSFNDQPIARGVGDTTVDDQNHVAVDVANVQEG
jgi:hypothetical protein